jgi:DNA-directed RNA polymerase subunit RPC12/RpoP
VKKKMAWLKADQGSLSEVNCTWCGIRMLVMREPETGRGVVVHDSGAPTTCPNEGKKYIVTMFDLEVAD